MFKKSNIDLVIVTFNSEKYIKQLLYSLKYIEKYLNKIVIIDNNSKKRLSLKKQVGRDVLLIQNFSNFGFSYAVNQGLRNCESELVLLLNPDSYFKDDSIKYMINTIKNNQVVATGGMLINFDGKSSLTANSIPNFLTATFEFTILKRLFPKNLYTKKFWLELSNQYHSNASVNSLCGAFLLLKRKVDNKLVQLDQRYFLYLEDLDLGINLTKQHTFIYCPKSRLYHFGGGSSNNKNHIAIKEWEKSRIQYFYKNLKFPLNLLAVTIFITESCILYILGKIYHHVQHFSSPSNSQRF